MVVFIFKIIIFLKDFYFKLYLGFSCFYIRISGLSGGFRKYGFCFKIEFEGVLYDLEKR